MKNFPHQYNELGRFRRTLTAIARLREQGRNVLDDGVLGYQLVRDGVYGFRGDVPDLEARIAQELRKPEGNQGPRTAARDGRRTLQLLGFIDASGALTDTGALLLQCAQGSPEEINLWRQAVMTMRVDADGNVSHPMRILLRILADRGPLPRGELALALEAKDDGEAEYERVLRLVPIEDAKLRGDVFVAASQRDIDRARNLRPTDAETEEYQRLLPIKRAIDRGAMVVTQANLANSVKILPALALQLGLAIDEGDDLIAISEIGATLYRADFQFGEIAVPIETAQPRQANGARTRRVGSNRRRIIPGQLPPPFDAETFSARSREEQIETIRLRNERTQRHEDVVHQLAAAFRDRFEVFEDPDSFDALLIPGQTALGHHLLEVKTLDLDEVDQTNRAVAQLFWYRWAKLPADVDATDLRLGVVYDRRPSEDTCRYLQSLNIGAFVCTDLKIEACNEAGFALCPRPVVVPEDYAQPVRP